MTKYNTTAFEPSAPLALVTLRNKKLGLSWADAPMLIDSGADITLIPQNAVERLNLTIASDMAYELSGFDGQKSVAPMVRLELVFCERIFRGQFLLIDQEWVILGRNVLNRVPLLLDGPDLTWREFQG